MDVPREVSDFLSDPDVSIVTRTFGKKATVREVRDIARNTLSDVVAPYYAQRGIGVNTGVFNFLVEPLKNANFYGSDDVMFKMFLSKNGLVASYADGGSYFTRPDVKYCWERRIEHPEKHPQVNDELGFGAGRALIYSLADLIFVDAKRGTLYTGLSLTNSLFH